MGSTAVRSSEPVSPAAVLVSVEDALRRDDRDTGFYIAAHRQAMAGMRDSGAPATVRVDWARVVLRAIRGVCRRAVFPELEITTAQAWVHAYVARHLVTAPTPDGVGDMDAAARAVLAQFPLSTVAAREQAAAWRERDHRTILLLRRQKDALAPLEGSRARIHDHTLAAEVTRWLEVRPLLP